MAIEVRIPTILRSYTGGAKSVEGGGRIKARAEKPVAEGETATGPCALSSRRDHKKGHAREDRDDTPQYL